MAGLALMSIAAPLFAAAQATSAPAPYPLRSVLDGAVAFCAADVPPPDWAKAEPAQKSWIANYVQMLREIAEDAPIRIATYEGVVAGRRLSAVISDLAPQNSMGPTICEVFDPLVEVDATADTLSSWIGRKPDDLPLVDEPGNVRVRWKPGLASNARTSEVTIVSPRLHPLSAGLRGGVAYAAEIRHCTGNTVC